MKSWSKRSSSRSLLSPKSYKSETQTDFFPDDSVFRELDLHPKPYTLQRNRSNIERGSDEYVYMRPVCYNSDSEASSDESSTGFTLLWNSREYNPNPISVFRRKQAQNDFEFANRDSRAVPRPAPTNKLLRTASEGLTG